MGFAYGTDSKPGRRRATSAQPSLRDGTGLRSEMIADVDQARRRGGSPASELGIYPSHPKGATEAGKQGQEWGWYRGHEAGEAKRGTSD